MKLTSIHHVALIAGDYECSKRFYTEVLGFRVVAENFRPERNSYKLDLIAGENLRIELFSFPQPPARLTRPEACGLRHLAFCVPDLDQALKALESAGVQYETPRIDEFTGKRFAFFSDPDGLPLELYEDAE